MQDKSIVIGKKEDGTDMTLGYFNDFIRDTLVGLFKKYGLKDKKVRVGTLIIKEDFKEELRKDGWK